MPKPEKVYIVGPTESILTQRGNRHPSLATFLVKQGYALEYVTSDFYHAEKRWFSREEIRLGQEKVPYTLTVKRCIGYRSNISMRRVVSNILLSMSFFVYLLTRLNRRTLLILPSRPVEMIFAAAILRLARGTSVLLDIRDVWPDGLVIPDRFRRGLFAGYCHAYLYPSLRFIDKFIHVAPSFVDWLHRYAPKARSVFVPLGFDADRWQTVSPRSEPTSEPIEIVCVALLQHLIDVMPILQAINGNERFRLTLIGDDGQGERYPEVMEFIRANGMKNVSMAGRLPPEAVVSHLERMDIGVVPMISSSIPNKVFDYVAAGLPIIVLGENDSAEFVEGMGIGWSCAYDEGGVRELLGRIDAAEIEAKRSAIAHIRDLIDRERLFLRVLSLLEMGAPDNLSPSDLYAAARNAERVESEGCSFGGCSTYTPGENDARCQV